MQDGHSIELVVKSCFHVGKKLILANECNKTSLEVLLHDDNLMGSHAQEDLHSTWLHWLPIWIVSKNVREMGMNIESRVHI
jgi:hypothetical protein